MALRLRRGTNASRTGVTPAEGELLYTTDTKKLYAGDGSTLGGNLVSGMNDLLEDVTPQLGGHLDMNSKNITGNGNINITGSVTATNFVGDYKGSIVGDDSTILVDAVASKIILSNKTIIYADDVKANFDPTNKSLKKAVAKGNVIIENKAKGRKSKADLGVYNSDDEIIRLTGNVVIINQKSKLSG